MDSYIELAQIMDLIYDIFGMSTGEVADHLLHKDRSILYKAIKGIENRYINRNEIEKCFFSDKLVVPGDKGNDERTQGKKKILAYLLREDLLYPDIAAVAEGSYADVVTALLNHYPPKNPKKNPNKKRSTKTDKLSMSVPDLDMSVFMSFDELMVKGGEVDRYGDYFGALEYYKSAINCLNDDPQNEIRVYNKMATAYLNIGDYHKAVSLYKRSLDICKHLYGQGSEKTAGIYQRLGVVYRKESKYREANECFVKAMEALNDKLKIDSNDASVANLYNDLGLMFLNEKLFDEAKEYYDKAYEMRKYNFDKYGEINNGYYLLEFAYSEHNMGSYYNKIVTDRIENMSDEYREECLRKAIMYHENAYNLRIRLLPGKDVVKAAKENSVCRDIAQTLTYWASDLLELGDTHQALEKCKLGLKIREEIFGKNAEHQDIAWSNYTLGLIYDKRCKLDKALECFKKSYKIRLNVANGEHLYAAKALYQVARITYKLALAGKYHPTRSVIMQYIEKAYEIQQRLLKEDDPELLETTTLLEQINSLNKRSGD